MKHEMKMKRRDIRLPNERVNNKMKKTKMFDF